MGLSGGLQAYTTQTIPHTDAEIAENTYLWMGTS